MTYLREIVRLLQQATPGRHGKNLRGYCLSIVIGPTWKLLK